MAMTLTKVEAALLQLIQTFRQEHGYSPTHRQLAHVMRQRHWSIQTTLERLARKGYVTWDRGVSRSLRVLPRDQSGQPSFNGSDLPAQQNTPELATLRP
ncbi:MAG: hypothetical protein HYZ73_05295 [Elusimicrobia bacterium]|nr:hypothetical protein [Elusimicrobiota bacterium]